MVPPVTPNIMDSEMNVVVKIEKIHLVPDTRLFEFE